MNTDRLHKLANIIAALPPSDGQSGFTMEHFVHECGTPACIAGWAVCVFGDSDAAEALKKHAHGFNNAKIIKMAVEALGLPDDPTAKRLFCPDFDGVARYAAVTGPEAISPARAAAVLRHLADTGEVDWWTIAA